MILFKKIADLKVHIDRQRSAGRQIGLVPTMGALHQGHLSLIDASKAKTGLTVCSIFVNPTQFNEPSDFQKYPVTIEQDIYLLEKNAADLLFLPDVEEIYPQGQAISKPYDLGYLETILEGQYRPGHFQGVCQVMHRMLDIVRPDHLFMGEKDYQQCLVVKKLLALLQSAVVFHSCPTVREADGLAMSSRNRRLDASARKKAAMIYQALIYIKQNLLPGKLPDLLEHAKNMLTAGDFKIDYVEIADAQTLRPVREWDGHQNLLALIAAFQDRVRLIDNMILNGSHAALKK